MPQTSCRSAATAAPRSAGPIPERYVVLPAGATPAGRAGRDDAARGAGPVRLLVLWRLDGAAARPRAALGFLPNGDVP